MNFKLILVPVDYSEPARFALRYAAELAVQFGAKLLVLHVWDQPSYVPVTVTVGPPNAARPLGELIRENAEQEMTDFLASSGLPEDLDFDRRLVSGEPASTILHAIETEAPNLIVIGTHGRTGVRHLLLGSIAEKIVRLSPVPVLTIPPPDRASAV